MGKPRFGLHIFNALFLLGFGSAVLWARLPTGSATYLPDLGLSVGFVGWLMVLSGGLILFTHVQWLQLLLTCSLLPYTLAGFLLFINTGAAQSIIVFTFLQLAMYMFIELDDLVARIKP